MHQDIGVGRGPVLGFAEYITGQYSNNGKIVFASSVPEPSTLALMALGLSCLAIQGRRRGKFIQK